MKKYFSLITIFLLAVLLVSCNSGEEEKIIYDGTVLEELPYFEYFSDDNPVVIIDVEGYGKMYAQLFPQVAKNTVDNFIQYIEKSAYDGSSFHRIIENFMIQGGKVEKTERSIGGEFSSNGFDNPLKHDRGVLSMARTNDPNSATSQFFIMHGTSPHLDGNYASFGGLISGFHILDSLATVETFWEQPIEEIIIKSIKINLNGYKRGIVIYNLQSKIKL